MLLYIVLQRISNKLDLEVSEMQAGFRKGHGCADMLTVLQVLLEKFVRRIMKLQLFSLITQRRSILLVINGCLRS